MTNETFLDAALWISGGLIALASTVISGAIIYENKTNKKEQLKIEQSKNIINTPLNCADFFEGLGNLFDNDYITFKQYDYIRKHLEKELIPFQETKKELTQETSTDLSKKPKRHKRFSFTIGDFFSIDTGGIEEHDYSSARVISPFSNRNFFANHPRGSFKDYPLFSDLYESLDKNKKFFNIREFTVSMHNRTTKESGWIKYFKNMDFYNEYSPTQKISFLLSPIDFSKFPEEYEELRDIHTAIENLKEKLEKYIQDGGNDEETISMIKSKISEGEEKGLSILSVLEEGVHCDCFDENVVSERKDKKTLELFEAGQKVNF